MMNLENELPIYRIPIKHKTGPLKLSEIYKAMQLRVLFLNLELSKIQFIGLFRMKFMFFGVLFKRLY